MGRVYSPNKSGGGKRKTNGHRRKRRMGPFGRKEKLGGGKRFPILLFHASPSSSAQTPEHIRILNALQLAVIRRGKSLLIIFTLFIFYGIFKA